MQGAVIRFSTCIVIYYVRFNSILKNTRNPQNMYNKNYHISCLYRL